MSKFNFKKFAINVCLSLEIWLLHISKKIIDALKNVLLLFTNLSKLLANVSIYIAPYVMLFIGQSVGIMRGRISVGGELFIPLYFFILKITFDDISEIDNKSCDIPTPVKRFTNKEGDEVSIEKSRLQELLVYVADLEDWLDDNNMI